MSEYIALMNLAESGVSTLVLVNGAFWEISRGRIAIKVGDYLIQIERRGHNYVDIDKMMLRAPGYPPDMDKLIATIPRVMESLSERIIVWKDSLVQSTLNRG